jgi:hypothetical protein
MKLLTFSIEAGKQAVNPFIRALDAPPAVAHTVGASSGLTGLALWAELAKHLTTFGGLLVVVITAAGASFYATYWCLKMLQKWREVFPAKHRRRVKASAED